MWWQDEDKPDTLHVPWKNSESWNKGTHQQIAVNIMGVQDSMGLGRRTPNPHLASVCFNLRFIALSSQSDIREGSSP